MTNACPKCVPPSKEEARAIAEQGLIDYMASLCPKHHQEALDALSKEVPFVGPVAS